VRILLVHNAYQQFGGEDVTFQNEKALLETAGHEVFPLLFSNDAGKTAAGKLSLAWRSIYNPASAQKVKEAIRSFRPDVMHVHNFFYEASPAIFYAAKSLGVPTVLTVQNYRLICAGAYLLRDGHVCELCVNSRFPVYGTKYGCYQSSVASAQLTLNTGIHKTIGTFKTQIDRYIVVTEFNKQKLMHSSLQLQAEQIVVKPNSVEDIGLAPTAGRTGPYLFVGRLSPEKGVLTLLEAAKKGGFPLEILGGGPLKERVEEAAASHPNIKYLGFQPRDVILDKMKRAQALLFTSVWYEGLPLTILEAMSCGLPILISNLGNLNEIVTEGKDGLWFTPGNADSLLGAIARFEAGDRTKLAEGARQTYLERYTPVQNLAGLEKVYSELKIEN
jgi:glycosyltransferase involved in cell wall biosynthesis